LADNKSLGSLVAESDVTRVSLFQGAQEDILAAVTAEGVVEVFKAPFSPIVPDSAAASRKKKALTRKGEAKVRIVRPNGKDVVSIADVSVQDEELVLVWVESGVNVEFERVRWAHTEDGSLVLSGTVDITRTKTNAFAANGAVMNGVKEVGKMAVDQSHAIVVAGGDTEDVGMEDAPVVSAESEEEDEEEEEEEEEEGEESPSDADDEEAAETAGEASFADRFNALEVAAKPTSALATLPTKKGPLAPPAANALTSVLTQALKTNDTPLLESCLHTTDSNTIMNTVRKLPSPLAVPLLETLAERLARKPGRAGSLGEWVRWTLVAHGGYLVTLPNLVRTLSALYSTLNTRAGALPRLLALQGRLDMLQAQVQLRKTIRSAAEGKGDGTDEGVLYVEGETPESDESGDDESDQEPEEVGMEGMMRIEDASYIKSPAAFADSEEEEEEDVEEDVDEELDNEDEDDEESVDDDEEDARAFLDVEASESEDDEGDDDDADSVDYDDVDESGAEEEQHPVPVKASKPRR
jgi:U3 small nucleolar RNA-associated protein 5